MSREDRRFLRALRIKYLQLTEKEKTAFRAYVGRFQGKKEKRLEEKRARKERAKTLGIAEPFDVVSKIYEFEIESPPDSRQRVLRQLGEQRFQSPGLKQSYDIESSPDSTDLVYPKGDYPVNRISLSNERLTITFYRAREEISSSRKRRDLDRLASELHEQISANLNSFQE